MSEIVELACCELLLELYRGAREMTVAEFPGFAFGLVKAVLRFDTARYTALKFLNPGAVVCTAHLHNEAIDTVFDWVEYPPSPYWIAAECTAVSPSSRRCIVADSASYAACWLAKSVSPPKAGNSTAYRIDARSGSGRKVTSVCHPPPKFDRSSALAKSSATK